MTPRRSPIVEPTGSANMETRLLYAPFAWRTETGTIVRTTRPQTCSSEQPVRS
jgi:hypothetical protein